jgi:hypothetical protein
MKTPQAAHASAQSRDAQRATRNWLDRHFETPFRGVSAQRR